jgi:phenylpyruvate tautomerase PptA (4-oxalocrotonate tautomerase family)
MYFLLYFEGRSQMCLRERRILMPLIQLDTSCDLGSPDKKNALAQALSQAAAKCIGKPEQYVMAAVQDNVAMTLGGTTEPCALVTVKSIGGLNRDVNQALAREVSGILQQDLGITDDRIYCVFEERPASHWAWKSNTFG